MRGGGGLLSSENQEQAPHSHLRQMRRGEGFSIIREPGTHLSLAFGALRGEEGAVIITEPGA